MALDLDKLKYPVGRFQRPDSVNDAQLSEWIVTIAEFPAKIRQLTGTLSNEQLSWCYRPEGWTIRQVVHHCSDSHMNSLIRLKWALTEYQPTIKAYQEAKWAELADSKSAPIGAALSLIDGLHERWVFLLKSMKKEDFSKFFIHPETGKEVRLDINTGLYAWHCEHHLGHIQSAIAHKGVFPI